MMEKSLNNLTYEETKDKALRLLTFRAHSEQELRQKLIRSGAVEEHISNVVDFLKNYGFLDDQKYAAAKAKELANIKKYGKSRIAVDLKNRGIETEYIDMALSEIEVDEFEALLPLVEKKLRGDFEKKSIDRVIRYFANKGYRYEDIKQCIEQIKNS